MQNFSEFVGVVKDIGTLHKVKNRMHRGAVPMRNVSFIALERTIACIECGRIEVLTLLKIRNPSQVTTSSKMGPAGIFAFYSINAQI